MTIADPNASHAGDAATLLLADWGRPATLAEATSDGFALHRETTAVVVSRDLEKDAAGHRHRLTLAVLVIDSDLPAGGRDRWAVGLDGDWFDVLDEQSQRDGLRRLTLRQRPPIALN